MQSLKAWREGRFSCFLGEGLWHVPSQVNVLICSFVTLFPLGGLAAEDLCTKPANATHFSFHLSSCSDSPKDYTGQESRNTAFGQVGQLSVVRTPEFKS